MGKFYYTSTFMIISLNVKSAQIASNSKRNLPYKSNKLAFLMSRFKNWNLSWRLKKRNLMLIRMKCLQNFRPKRSNLRKNGPNSSHNSVFLRILVVLLTNLNKWSRRKTSHRVHHRNLNQQSPGPRLNPGQLERPLNPNRKKPRIKLLLINGKFIPKRVNLS